MIHRVNHYQSTLKPLVAIRYRGGVDILGLACYTLSINNNKERDLNMWYDSEVYGGQKKSDVAKLDVFYGPENKMELPCDSCSLLNKCASNVTECSAFKTWTTYGYYDSQKVGKLVKKVA